MAGEAAAHVASGLELWQVVALLGAGVVAVPLFKKAGLGSVLAYLAAGLAVGPFGLGLVADTQSILHVSELGVVLFLFIVGLEMEPAKLWGLRKQIFGLGVLQVGIWCGPADRRRHAAGPLPRGRVCRGRRLRHDVDGRGDPTADRAG